jgi:hypothetical protein
MSNRIHLTTLVLSEVDRERQRQDEKWGEQNHPDGTGSHFREDADDMRRVCEWEANHGELAWRHILREEVYEALAESDPAKLRAELIQVAAVAVNWIEAIDRRQKTAEVSNG